MNLLKQFEKLRHDSENNKDIIERFNKLREELHLNGVPEFLKQLKEPFNTDDPVQNTIRIKAIEAMQTLKMQVAEYRQRHLNDPEGDSPTPQKHPKFLVNGKLRINNILGIELVTLTIMVLQKNGIKDIKEIENQTLFAENLIRAVDIGKKYESESFRVQLHNLTEDERDYPWELKGTKPRKFNKLNRFLLSDAGKEFERIVMENL